MKRFTIIIMLCLAYVATMAQCVEVDVFEDLVYRSHTSSYKANLREDIFESLIFTDSNNNRIEYKRKYIDLKLHHIYHCEKDKIHFFEQLVKKNRNKRGYMATYSVNAYDRVVVEEQYRNRKPHGHVHHSHSSVKMRNIRTDHHGNMMYFLSKNRAWLKRDRSGRYTYTDSSGNELRIGAATWKMLLRKHKTKKEVFASLIDQFLVIRKTVTTHHYR